MTTRMLDGGKVYSMPKEGHSLKLYTGMLHPNQNGRLLLVFGAGNPDPEIGEGPSLQKKFFSPSGFSLI